MKKPLSQGFTLVELMIVVAIIGVLGSIAYPSYMDYVLRAKRGDAKVALLGAQLAQEKYRANNSTYGTTLELIGVIATSPEGNYNIAIVGGADATTYLITADPTFTDSDCGVYAVNQDGKIIDNDSYADTGCWSR
ncbi:type IV pilin protein [Methyloprofundus sp.]|uniref:type IV pilin protein n=1 Tax=Methyloprofundus sp. TaxID=2020875 RepID=UPI003D0C704A